MLPIVGRIVIAAALVVLIDGCSGAQTGAIPGPSITTAQRQLHGSFVSAKAAVTETVLHSFGTGDGEVVYAGLTNVKGTLYGTTIDGGASGYGTVFKITTAGKESVLHSFTGSGDGAYPYGGLIDVKGTLYGTTLSAGGSACYSNGCGTVFKITTSGKERVVYSFKGGPGDGAFPEAGLTDVNGTLFGTTSSGGSSNLGAVFRVTT